MFTSSARPGSRLEEMATEVRCQSFISSGAAAKGLSLAVTIASFCWLRTHDETGSRGVTCQPKKFDIYCQPREAAPPCGFRLSDCVFGNGLGQAKSLGGTVPIAGASA
jgi:hypothetical protein